MSTKPSTEALLTVVIDAEYSTKSYYERTRHPDRPSMSELISLADSVEDTGEAVARIRKEQTEDHKRPSLSKLMDVVGNVSPVLVARYGMPADPMIPKTNREQVHDDLLKRSHQKEREFMQARAKKAQLELQARADRKLEQEQLRKARRELTQHVQCCYEADHLVKAAEREFLNVAKSIKAIDLHPYHAPRKATAIDFGRAARQLYITEGLIIPVADLHRQHRKKLAAYLHQDPHLGRTEAVSKELATAIKAYSYCLHKKKLKGIHQRAVYFFHVLAAIRLLRKYDKTAPPEHYRESPATLHQYEAFFEAFESDLRCAIKPEISMGAVRPWPQRLRVIPKPLQPLFFRLDRI